MTIFVVNTVSLELISCHLMTNDTKLINPLWTDYPNEVCAGGGRQCCQPGTDALN